ncbi:MAG: class I SAM-dependent methyltransferase [Pseudolabrys sp.]
MSSDGQITAIDYSHDDTLHSVRGAELALSALFLRGVPGRILDIGCGTRSWLAAARKLGVREVVGVDGISVADELLKLSRDGIMRHDLRMPLELDQTFDLYLPGGGRKFGGGARQYSHRQHHASRRYVLVFGGVSRAGCTHHVNCQWPEYWQARFNKRGSTCSDDLRWKVWNESEIEPWYRQNMFVAVRDSAGAGHEARIVKAIHPDMLPTFSGTFFDEHRSQIENGFMPFAWYAQAPVVAAVNKLKRFFRKRSSGK